MVAGIIVIICALFSLFLAFSIKFAIKKYKEELNSPDAMSGVVEDYQQVVYKGIRYDPVISIPSENKKISVKGAKSVKIFKIGEEIKVYKDPERSKDMGEYITEYDVKRLNYTRYSLYLLTFILLVVGILLVLAR
ncbi:MAG: hypothetical protein Q4D02_05740 [Clostridia bacterium]|nr:hypothetical protein [Clostridia bacterium]